MEISTERLIEKALLLSKSRWSIDRKNQRKILVLNEKREETTSLYGGQKGRKRRSGTIEA